METFSALLALCAGNSPVPGEFPAQRPVTRSFYVFFDLRLNKWLSKQSWGWWFETLSCPLWRHRNDYPVYGRQHFAEFTTSWGAKGQSSYKSNQSTNISTTPGPIALWIFRRTSIFIWNFAESHNIFWNRQIPLKFCTEHGSNIAVPCAKFQKGFSYEKISYERTRFCEISLQDWLQIYSPYCYISQNSAGIESTHAVIHHYMFTG